LRPPRRLGEPRVGRSTACWVGGTRRWMSGSGGWLVELLERGGKPGGLQAGRRAGHAPRGNRSAAPHRNAQRWFVRAFFLPPGACRNPPAGSGELAGFVAVAPARL